MSKSIANKVIHFAFSPTPSVNPYRTTANYINTFLQPCPIPWWAIYIEHCIGLVFIIMVCQASYILHLRYKTKKFYDIGFNRLGMIQLDRANHCALCYFCYGLIAGIHIICGDLMVSGHLDQAWPNFLLGIKCTITIAFILWLCVSHFALTNQRQNESHESSSGPLRSYIMARVLNVCLVTVLALSTLPILVSFLQLTMAYIRVKNIVTPIINVLLNSASTYSVHTYRPENLVAQILPSLKALHYIDLIVQFTHNGLTCYVVISAFICLMYIPFLFLLFASIYQRKELREAQELRKKQKDVLVNSILELTIMILFIACNCYGLGIFHDGDFIFDLRFWIAIRLGTNGVIAIFGNIALYLISRSLQRFEMIHEKTHM